jgi:hypothetical protein
MGLLQLRGSTQVLQDIGPSTVGGQQVTVYQLGPSTCQTSATGLTQTYSTVWTTLWVDSHGRLIQGEDTQTVVIHPPRGTDIGATASTDTTSVRLFDFGTPAHIGAPPNATQAPGGAATSGCP